MSEEVPGTEAPVVPAEPADGGAIPAAKPDAAQPVPKDGETPPAADAANEQEKPEDVLKALRKEKDKAIRQRWREKARADFLDGELARARQLQAPPAATVDPNAPQIGQFSDIADYETAIRKHERDKASREFEDKQRAQLNQRATSQLTTAWETKAERGAEKYDDFYEIVGDMKPTTHVEFAIMDEDNGEEIAYYLAKNHAELKAIMGMSDNARIRAIGKLAAKLAAQPVVPKTPSQAPAPIVPVSGKSGGANDAPSDSDDIATWMKKENARLKKQASMHH